MALRRQRPEKPLPDSTGCQALLHTTAALGSLLVAFGSPGPGHPPHPQGRPDHRHRHQRGLSSARGGRHSRGLEHPPRHPKGLLDGPHGGTAQGAGPSGCKGNDRSASATRCGDGRPGSGRARPTAASTPPRTASISAGSRRGSPGLWCCGEPAVPAWRRPSMVRVSGVLCSCYRPSPGYPPRGVVWSPLVRTHWLECWLRSEWSLPVKERTNTPVATPLVSPVMV